MSVDNTNVQMKKGILEYCVLHIISRGEVYTSDLISELAQARLVVVEGTLYPLLTRLKNAGWLEYKWVESAYGPPRKYYSLTAIGTEMLGQLDQTWLEIKHAVNLIVGNKLEQPPALPNDVMAQTQPVADTPDLPAEPDSQASKDQEPAAKDQTDTSVSDDTKADEPTSPTATEPQA